MTAPAKTPEWAEAKGDWWHRVGLAHIAVGFVLAVFGVTELMWLAVLVALWCSRESADYYGWRRGYLAREREERQAREGSGVSHG